MSFQYDPKLIRNFTIIAHIDHGKSTLADRLLERTELKNPPQHMDAQFLDNMELEKERGITIKACPVTTYYKYKGQYYQINLIDTPGHVDFAYEVSRSLSACEGTLLVIDASQGIQAQTLANLFLAIDKDLFILPVFNKIDLEAASVEEVKMELESSVGLDVKNSSNISAKSGLGVDELLESIIENIPAPSPPDATLQALVFDSHYDSYRGVFVYVRIVSGSIKKGDRIIFMAQKKETEVLEVGIFSPTEYKTDILRAGEVGYIVSNIKDPHEIRIGDTVTLKNDPIGKALSGFKHLQPALFASVYSVDGSKYINLKDAIIKLQLNDSALTIEPEHSQALGMGFRCGFLGALHLEITFERLKREFNLDVIMTAPSITYKFHLKDGTTQKITNPAHMPSVDKTLFIEEPIVISHLMIPSEYLGATMNLSTDMRGELINTETVGNRILLTCRFPFNEIVSGFSDKLKSVTKGYGSFDYEFSEYVKSDIIKLEVRVNGEIVEAFTYFVHKTEAVKKGKQICKKLKEVIPRQLYKIAIQAVIGSNVIARETVAPYRKDVTAKLYGGDYTRKQKLLKKQKKGRKRLEEMGKGKVPIPEAAFIQVLKSIS